MVTRTPLFILLKAVVAIALLAVSAIPAFADPVGQGSPAGQANRWPMFLSDGTNPVGSTSNPLTIQGPSADNSANSTQKTPVLPCRANIAAPTFTEGNQVPCSVDLSGNLRTTTALTVTSVQPVQGVTLLNSSTTSAANTSIVITLTGAAGKRIHIYRVDAYCSAGTTAVTINDGPTMILNSPGTYVGTSVATWLFPVGLSGTTGNNMSVVLGSCGVGNTGTVNVQADQF